LSRQISKLELFLTEDCNLRCDYCYIQKRPSNMSWEVAKKSIDVWLNEFDPKVWYVIELFGGEPLLRFDLIKKIEEYVSIIEKEKNFRVSYRLVTNGTILNNEIINFLKTRPYFFIAVSCDGIKKVHDKHRKDIAGNGTFDIIIKNLEKFKQHGFFKSKKVSINMVVTPDTVRYFYENHRFFADFDENLSFAENFFQATKWKNSDFKEYQKQVELIIQLEKEKLQNQQKCRDKIIFGMIKKIITEDTSRYICQAGRLLGMTVDSKGDIFLCHRFESLKRDSKLKNKLEDFYLGNIMNYEKIDQTKWNHQKKVLQSYIQENKYPRCKTCDKKEYCSWIRCFWNNYAVYHNLYKHNENVCKKLDHFLPPTLSFYNWLKKEGLLDQYLAGFNFIHPEKRPVCFINREIPSN